MTAEAPATQGITVAELLALIDGLDEIFGDDDHLDLTRWTKSGGETDIRLTAVVRQLARERLGAFPVEDIGLEVLRQIDRRASE